MNNRRKFLENSFFYLIAMILPNFISFIILPIYTKYIPPEEYGIYSITASIIGVMSILSAMGLNVFYLKSYTSYDNKEELNGTVYWSLCIWNIILFVTSAISLPLLFKYVKITVPFYPFVFLALLTQLFNSMEIIPMRTFRIRGEVKYYLIRILFKTIFSAGLGLFFVVALKKGILGRYYAELLNSIIFAVIFINYMIKHSNLKINKKLFIKAIKFSIPIVPSDLLQMSTPLIVNLIIQKMLSLSQLGVYSIGLTISGIVQLVTTSISLAVEPEVYGHSEEKTFPEFFTKIKNLSLVAVSIVSVGVILFIRDTVVLFLPQVYWNSWKVVQVVAISYIISALKGSFSQLVIIQGNTKILSQSNFIYLVICSITSLFSLLFFGEEGLGVANVIGMLAAFLSVYVGANKSNFKELLISRDLFNIFIAVSILYISRKIYNFNLIINFLINLSVFFIYVIILCYLYRVNITKIWPVFSRKEKNKI